jgi:hypothetical protein
VRGTSVGFPLTILVAAGLLSSCGFFSTCPESVAAALNNGVPGQTDATLIAVGRVVRYVDSTDAAYRGYDLDIRRVLAGDAVDTIVFLRAQDEISGIQRLSPVLVVAEIGGTPPVLTTGDCQPLREISEAELIRWTGSA